MKQTTRVNLIISLEGQYKPRNGLNNVTFTLLIMNRGKWNWFKLKSILNNTGIKQTSRVNLIKSLEGQYKPTNGLNNVSFTLLIMNRGKRNWFYVQTILNKNDIEKTSWLSHIISLDRQSKPTNGLNNVTFTFLIMNRGKRNWFYVQTILNKNDIVKTSWLSHIISLDRQSKPTNGLNNVTFTFLIMNRGKWNWFWLETILNNTDIKQTSWVKFIISLDRQYKPRNCLNNVTFTLLIINRGKSNLFKPETIINNNDKITSWVNL